MKRYVFLVHNASLKGIFMSKKTDAIKATIMEPHKPNRFADLCKVREEDLLSTGSTLLNLACSGKSSGGFLKGHFYGLVGDSTSGKTFLAMNLFAEACCNDNFKDYRFIYDNSEDGCLMDIERLFGNKTVERVEPPSMDKNNGKPLYSVCVEDFYYNVDDAVKIEKPFIYILDSMDSLSSVSEGSKFEEHKKASRAGTKAPGSYGDGKAKKNSEGLRKLLSPLTKSGSIVLILGQTRANIGGYGEQKIRSGGSSLKFYNSTEIWLSVKGSVKKTVRENVYS